MGLNQNGYFLVQTEYFGFTEEVYVIVFPKEKIMEFKMTNNPEKMTKIFKAEFTRKFYIPAEYDVFILISPIDTEEHGYFGFRFRSQYFIELPSKIDATSEVIERLPY